MYYFDVCICCWRGHKAETCSICKCYFIYFHWLFIEFPIILKLDFTLNILNTFEWRNKSVWKEFPSSCVFIVCVCVCVCVPYKGLTTTYKNEKPEMWLSTRKLCLCRTQLLLLLIILMHMYIKALKQRMTQNKFQLFFILFYCAIIGHSISYP